MTEEPRLTGNLLMSLNERMEEMFQFSNQYYMGVNCFVVSIQILSIISNGFIIYLFAQTPRLRRNAALRLILLLSITDFLFAWSSIPYMINYIVYWDPVEFNYDGIRVIILSLPLTIQFKINLIITTALALDRLQAMKFSFYYRQKNQNLFVFQTLFVGFGLSLIDVYFEFKMDPLPVNKGCAAVGCFTSLTFRYYWGSTNMALSLFLLLCTSFVARELKKLNKTQHKMSPKASKVEGSVAQANRLCIVVLIIALIFQTIPSVLVGMSDLVGLNSFQKLGPFYIVGLLLCGFFNSVVYITFHLELQLAAKRAFGLVPKTPVSRTITTLSRSTNQRSTNVAPSALR